MKSLEIVFFFLDVLHANRSIRRFFLKEKYALRPSEPEKVAEVPSEPVKKATPAAAPKKS